ncbi:hypothetical protein BpHYR1_009718 [Brachionus plicatilis]|uniref:Uncharacterized protein n=1 Tax=Brachionus plicatilis TaxID=10195 RepID=A0A3M7PW60_BRAPC|nr:hypothetical protein BpHYR1_009718 [Brachionus plicatilis]
MLNYKQICLIHNFIINKDKKNIEKALMISAFFKEAIPGVSNAKGIESCSLEGIERMSKSTTFFCLFKL